MSVLTSLLLPPLPPPLLGASPLLDARLRSPAGHPASPPHRRSVVGRGRRSPGLTLRPLPQEAPVPPWPAWPLIRTVPLTALALLSVLIPWSRWTEALGRPRSGLGFRRPPLLRLLCPKGASALHPWVLQSKAHRPFQLSPRPSLLRLRRGLRRLRLLRRHRAGVHPPIWELHHRGPPLSWRHLPA